MATETAASSATAAHRLTALDLKIEVVGLAVADVDRSKTFYERLGWRVDADFASGDEWRLVQMTAPGSPCSIMFGRGFTSAAPGSVQGTFLVVDDIDAARAELIAKGVEVSEVFHFEGDLLNVRGERRAPGRDPQRRSYFSFASFQDPDGNSWLLQEVTARFPGRGLSSDIATLTALLRETEERHGRYEAAAPKHHWSEWYGSYIVARQRGSTPDDSAEQAAANVERNREAAAT